MLDVIIGQHTWNCQIRTHILRRYTQTRTPKKNTKKKYNYNQQTIVTHFGENQRLHLERSKQNHYIISLWVIIKAIFIYTNTHNYTQTHAQTHAYIHTHTHAHPPPHTHTPTHTHTHTNTHTHTHTHTHKRMQEAIGCQFWLCADTAKKEWWWCYTLSPFIMHRSCRYMHVHKYNHIYTHIYISTHIYIYTYVYIYIYM